MNIIDQVGKYFSDTAHLLALIPLFLAISFLIFWFIRSAVLMRADGRDPTEWVRTGPEALFQILRRGKLTAQDVAPMLGVTLIYAAAALFYLGSLKAPQSFWRSSVQDYTILVDLGEPVTVDTLYYYCGNFHGPDNAGHYSLEFSEDGQSFRAQPDMLQKHSMPFSWRTAELTDALPTRFVRITALHAPLELGELCIIGENGRKLSPVTITPVSALALFDEDGTSPGADGRTSLNGSYFDEIYHARTAFELLRGDPIYETTHPPLGKEIIAAGIALFGMNPFGWRIAGTLCGIFMLPLFYLLIKQLFNSTLTATAATVVWAADFMHLTQTRIATIDVYNVFFVLLMALFMHRWMTIPDDKPFLYTLPPLFMCGLSFGLGAASKWSSLYFGPALVALYVWKMTARIRWSRKHGRPAAGFVQGTLLCSVLFFILVPFVVYMASYIPYVRGEPLTPVSLWNAMYANQVSMFNYHSGLTDTHSAASRWYEWVVNARPVCYFYELDSATNAASIIDAFYNPILCWGGIAALGITAAGAMRRRSYQTMFILICYASVLVPWIPVQRVTFMYHYFPASMFMVIALAYVFWRIEQAQAPAARTHILLFPVACVLVFALFYPALTGIPIPRGFARSALQWLPSWPF